MPQSIHKHSPEILSVTKADAVRLMIRLRSLSSDEDDTARTAETSA